MQHKNIEEILTNCIIKRMEEDSEILFLTSNRKRAGILKSTAIKERVVFSDLSSHALGGLGTGAALRGLKPIIEYHTTGPCFPPLNQIMDLAAATHFMSGGELTIPAVFLFTGACQKSQTLTPSQLARIPGLVTITPSSIKTMEILFRESINLNSPVAFFPPSKISEKVESNPSSTTDIGKSCIKKQGSDLTLVAWGSSLKTALTVAEKLSADNTEAEVIDLETLFPVDEKCLIESVKKTNYLAIIQDDDSSCSYGSWLSHLVCLKAFDHLDAPPVVLSSLNTPLTVSPSFTETKEVSADNCYRKCLEMLK